MKTSTLKFIHLGDKGDDHAGRITICSLINNDSVEYGVSYCSPLDKFKKSLGRTISTNRLISDPIAVNLTDDEFTNKLINISILTSIIDSRDFPDWAHPIIIDSIDWFARPGKNNQYNDIELIESWLNDMPFPPSTKLIMKMVSDRLGY